MRFPRERIGRWQALHQDAWIAKIDLQHTFSLDHFLQFVDLWTRLANIHLNPEVSDEISWKLTTHGLRDAILRLHYFPLVQDGLEGLGPAQDQFFLLGLQIKIVCGRPTGWRREGGQIAALATYASNVWKPSTTSSSIAAALLAYGPPSRNGWVYPKTHTMIGQTSPSPNGGNTWRGRAPKTAKPWLP